MRLRIEDLSPVPDHDPMEKPARLFSCAEVAKMFGVPKQILEGPTNYSDARDSLAIERDFLRSLLRTTHTKPLL